MNRLLVIARDFNSAKHWSHEKKLSPGKWFYVSSYHNIFANSECDYIKIPGHELRSDISVIDSCLKENNCKKIENI